MESLKEQNLFHPFLFAKAQVYKHCVHTDIK